MTFHVVIPARYAAQRLPGKLLLDLAGKPVLHHTIERALATSAASVIVATDDQRIADACASTKARVIMTSENHQSGTDRVAEVARHCRWNDQDIVVNVQGDEPFLPAENIDQVAQLLLQDCEEKFAMATLACHFSEQEIASLAWHDTNSVKVVCNAAGSALYFSRAPIPWPRDDAREKASQTQPLKHLGIYAYRASRLQELAGMSPCALEQCEKLEQLRALWHGWSIRVAVALETPGPGIDTQHDLDAARALLNAK